MSENWGEPKVVTIENGAELGRCSGAASPQPRGCLIYFGGWYGITD
jgi:hypothetical protein